MTIIVIIKILGSNLYLLKLYW